MTALDADLPLVIRSGDSRIELINFVQQKEPYSDRSPQVQLELRIKEREREEHFFLWHWKDAESGTNNYPRAFGSHILSLSEHDNQWFLSLEKASFSQEFYLSLNHSVRWEGLEMTFLSSLTETSYDSEGNFDGSLIRSEIRLTAGTESKTIFAESSDESNSQDLDIGEKRYTLRILGMGEDDLKLLLSP